MTSSVRRSPDHRGGTVTLVDTNVLLDVFTEDPSWFEWSAGQLRRAADEGDLAVNPIIYAEISVHFKTIEALDEALPAEHYRRESLPYAAGFLVGKAHLRYRRTGGTKTTPLPDFYIGAHAAICEYRLLTRDAKRFRSYFSTVDLVTPD